MHSSVYIDALIDVTTHVNFDLSRYLLTMHVFLPG